MLIFPLKEHGIADAYLLSMKIRSTDRRIQGLTLFEVLVVIAVLVFLAAALLPNIDRGERRKAPQINCVNNLKETYLGFKIWESEHTNFPVGVSITNGGAMEFAEWGIAYRVFQVASNELTTPKILYCRVDMGRTAATNFSSGFDNSHLSYFVGMVTNDFNPNAIILGDDNLVINGMRVHTGVLTLPTNSVVGWTKDRHDGRGNIGLADGSVQQTTVNGLNAAIRSVEAPTRIVVP